MPGAAEFALSLLIVDDNPSSLELLSDALAQRDLKILTASDPEQAIDLFCDRRPQIVSRVGDLCTGKSNRKTC